ncbi:MAG: thioredoxin domain-containing protein [Bdellovibrionales bacterium]|nr:thioredoxin domain-containing protein [Bdellovibrionales bacterium]
MKWTKFLPLAFVLLFSVACSEEYIKKVLKDNPEILAEVIEENPKVILEALNKASLKYRQEQLKAAEEQKVKSREDEFKNPKKPELGKDRVYFGDANAPITVVEYSDFQCGFCKRAGEGAVKQILKEYEGKVRILYKHLPLPFHPEAGIAAQYYEAVGKVDSSKAKAFHDKLFEKQSELGQKKEELLKEIVKELGLNLKKVQDNLESAKAIVDADEAEAKKFGINGTPGFLVGGVSLSGAQPFSEFKTIIDRLLADMEKK